VIQGINSTLARIGMAQTDKEIIDIMISDPN